MKCQFVPQSALHFSKMCLDLVEIMPNFLETETEISWKTRLIGVK